MAKKIFLTRDEVRDVYDKYAGAYDLAVWFYYLVGMRIDQWRRLVSARSLKSVKPKAKPSSLWSTSKAGRSVSCSIKIPARRTDTPDCL